MDSQKEYDLFVAKVSKAVIDIRNDFDHLSPENQKRFAEAASAVLKGYGYAITANDVLQRLAR